MASEAKTEKTKLLPEQTEKAEDEKLSVEDTESEPEDDQSRDIRRFQKRMIDEDPRSWTRFLDKVYFVLGVWNMLVLCIGVFSDQFHWFLPYYYSFKFPLLIGYRFWSYHKSSMHLFLLDFCYFGNLLLLTYIWIFPHVPELFTVAMALAFGPFAFAIMLYRNSLVFHDIDKITSLFIHISPGIVCYVIRYYPKETSKFWHHDFANCLSMHRTAACKGVSCSLSHGECNVGWSPEDFLYSWGLPLLFFMTHAFLYFLVLQVCPLTEKYRNNKKYMTSYRYMTASRSSLLFKVINVCGPRMRVYLYGLVNTVVTALLLLPAIVWYNNQYLLIAYFTGCNMVATWNGANYYMEVFSRRYDGVEHCEETHEGSSKKA